MSHSGPIHGAGHHPGSSTGLLARIQEHVGFTLTLGYVLVSVVGISVETFLLAEFHTSYLTYAEPEDFLMAGLRHPVVILFVGLSAALLFLLLSGVRALEQAWPGLKKSTEKYNTPGIQAASRLIVYPLFILLYFLLFTVKYTGSESQKIRQGEGREVRLEFQTFRADSTAAPLYGHVVATTSRYVFLYSGVDQRMHILPLTAVREILISEKRHAPPPARP